MEERAKKIVHIKHIHMENVNNVRGLYEKPQQ